MHLVQAGNGVDDVERIDMQIVPLVAAMKSESQLHNNLIRFPKVSIKYFTKKHIELVCEVPAWS